MADKPFSIIDLINEAGIENVGVQFLHQCVKGAELTKQRDTAVTFFTDKFSPNDLMRMINGGTPSNFGVIVWINGEKFREIQKKFFPASNPVEAQPKEQHESEQPAPRARRASGSRRSSKRGGG